MTWHLAGWHDSVAASTVQALDPILDQILPIQSNQFFPAQNLPITAAYASGVSLLEAYLRSPTLIQTNPAYIRPVQKTLLPPTDPNLMSLIRSPLMVMGQEGIQPIVTTDATGTEDIYVLAFFDWLQKTPVPMGQMFMVKFTATLLAIAGNWTQCVYNFINTLPVGQYTMVGSEVFSATGIAHRWTFDNQYPRPGWLSFAVEADRGPRELYQCQLGSMGVFNTYSVPRLEVLCNAADTTLTGYMYVVKTGSGQPSVPTPPFGYVGGPA